MAILWIVKRNVPASIFRKLYPLLRYFDISASERIDCQTAVFVFEFVFHIWNIPEIYGPRKFFPKIFCFNPWAYNFPLTSHSPRENSRGSHLSSSSAYAAQALLDLLAEHTGWFPACNQFLRFRQPIHDSDELFFRLRKFFQLSLWLCSCFNISEIKN